MDTSVRSSPCEILAAQQNNNNSNLVHEGEQLWITCIAIYLYEVGDNQTLCDQFGYAAVHRNNNETHKYTSFEYF